MYERAKFDVLCYKYRRLFGLSYDEFLNEPVSEFNKNLMINSEIREHNRKILHRK